MDRMVIGRCVSVLLDRGLLYLQCVMWGFRKKQWQPCECVCMECAAGALVCEHNATTPSYAWNCVFVSVLLCVRFRSVKLPLNSKHKKYVTALWPLTSFTFIAAYVSKYEHKHCVHFPAHNTFIKNCHNVSGYRCPCPVWCSMNNMWQMTQGQNAGG